MTDTASTEIFSKDETVTVFISYSWDSDEHCNWVLNLATKLAENGVYVILDRFDLKAGKTMTQFMEKAVNQSDKVLLIMTPNYKDKADNRVGGVGYEYSMITQELYLKQDSEKFIPIRKNGTYDECAPKFLSSFISHNMTTDTTFDKDFTDLLRIIYDEPEIKRPPLGKKPIFVSASKTGIETSLINDKANLELCQMTTFAKWTIDFRLNSLVDQDKANVFKLITSNVIVDKENKNTLPYVLMNNHKVGHHPEILYEIPLHRYIAFNHLMHEKLKIEDGLIHYEFSEYSNHDFWLLHTSQPFSTIFYLAITLNNIHIQLKRSFDITFDINFYSDKKACLYSKYSPFDYDFSFATYEIPGSKAKLSCNLTVVNKDTIFNLYEKLYLLFVSENPKSPRPYPELKREHFDMVTNDFLK